MKRRSLILSMLMLGVCAPRAMAIVAGSSMGTPADSPEAHVDANVSTSAFAGVGAVLARVSPTQAYLGTGTLLDATHVLTAGHITDTDNNGVNDFSLSDITFTLNANGNASSVIGVSAVTYHPNFTGFKPGDPTDDLCILTLSQAVPVGTPTYGVLHDDTAFGSTLTLVGYGKSGTGNTGITVNASATVKRVGYNVLDHLSDYVGNIAEIWRYDFDGPTGHGIYGGGTLGNTLESAIAPGDSGGPAFIQINGNYILAGTSTFTTSANVGLFGSQGGGMYLPAYASWIDSVLAVPEPSGMAMALFTVAGLFLTRRRNLAA